MLAIQFLRSEKLWDVIRMSVRGLYIFVNVMGYLFDEKQTYDKTVSNRTY